MMGWAHSSGPIAQSLFADKLDNCGACECPLSDPISFLQASYHRASFEHPVFGEQVEAQR